MHYWIGALVIADLTRTSGPSVCHLVTGWGTRDRPGKPADVKAIRVEISYGSSQLARHGGVISGSGHRPQPENRAWPRW